MPGVAEPGSAGPGVASSTAVPDVELPGADSIGVLRADARSAPFFAAAARNELLIKRCDGCGSWQGPSASHCPECGDSARLSWAVASGAATLISWAVVHPRAGGPVAIPAFAELAEGPWLSTALWLADTAELAALHAGQPLTAEFVHPADGDSYPVFRLA